MSVFLCVLCSEWFMKLKIANGIVGIWTLHCARCSSRTNERTTTNKSSVHLSTIDVCSVESTRAMPSQESFMFTVGKLGLCVSHSMWHGSHLIRSVVPVDAGMAVSDYIIAADDSLHY